MEKIKNNNIIIFFIFSFFYLMGCEKSTEPNPIEEISNGILPLKVGYYWKYKNYIFNHDGSILYEDTEDEYIIAKSSTIVLENQNYIVFHRTWGYLDPELKEYRYGSDEWLYRNFDDGLYLMGSNAPADTIHSKLLQYKYPVGEKDIWESPHLVYNLIENKYTITDSIKYTCTDTNALFETSLGNFLCVVYYHRESLGEDVAEKADIYEYYTKDVGLVGTITYSYFPLSQESYLKRKKILISTNVLTK